MVACGIALVLGLLLTRLFQSSSNWQVRNLRRTNLQQQLMVALQRIGSELQQSTPTGITPGPNRLALQKLADITPDMPARHIWETYLVVYFVNSAGLQRRQWPPQPPSLAVTLSSSAPFHPDPSQMAALCLSSGALRMGRNVSLLQVSSPNSLPITVNVTVAEEGDSYSRSRTISLRNAE